MAQKKNKKTENKKTRIGRIYALILLLFVFALGGVVYPIYRYAMMTPEEHASIGMQAFQEKHYLKAERHLQKAADANDPTAAYVLGSMLLEGEDGLPKDIQRAAEFFEKSAGLGNRHAQYTLALLYDRGEGVPEDKSKALNWSLLAAAQGDIDATYAAAVWLDRGYSGRPEPFIALSLYEQAASMGHLNAMKSLILVYSSGVEVPQNMKRADYWKGKLEVVQREKSPHVTKPEVEVEK